MTWASRIIFFLTMAFVSSGMATAEEAASTDDDLTILLRADKARSRSNTASQANVSKMIPPSNAPLALGSRFPPARW